MLIFEGCVGGAWCNITQCRARILNPKVWEPVLYGTASGCFLQGIRFDGDSWKAKVLTFECMEHCGELSLPNMQWAHVRGKNSNPFLCACFFCLPFMSPLFPLLEIPICIYSQCFSTMYVFFPDSLIRLNFFLGERKPWCKSRFCDSISARHVCCCWQSWEEPFLLS